MNTNYAVIAYKKDNENVLIVAEGDRSEMQSLLPTVKAIIQNAKIVSVDEEDYERCKNDIKFQNDFISSKM